VHDAARGLRAVLRDELLEGEALEILHRLVEGPLGRVAEVVRDRVRVAEARGELDLALEASQARFSGTPRRSRW
jgi:hypothetical protein